MRPVVSRLASAAGGRIMRTAVASVRAVHGSERRQEW